MLSVLLGFLTVGSSIGLLSTSAWLIAAAALQPSIADLQVAIVGVRFFGLARGVFRYLERLASHEVTFRVLGRLRVRLYEALEPIAPAGLLGERSGDLLSRLVADVGTLEHFYIRAVAPPLVALLVAGLTAVLLASFDPRLVLPFLAAYVLAGMGVPLLVQLLNRQPGRDLIVARADLYAALVDGIQGLADLVAYGAHAAHLSRVERLGEGLAVAQLRLAGVTALGSALVGLAANLAVLAVLALAIPLVENGHLAGVNLAVLALLTGAGFEAVAALPLAAQYWESSLAAAGRILGIGDWRARPVSSSAAEDGLSQLDRQCSIAFEDVSFRYATDLPPVLDGVSFSVPAGRHIAIVGPSGAGKSTLVNLLVRFWDDYTGSIRLADRELREYAPETVRSLIAVVAQNAFLFTGTIRENLALARPEANQAELEAAARRAQLHDFIMGLPQGYDTWIGEGGLRLSGGERQRLAIARAVLRDAPILILDEATGHLDPPTEQALLHIISAAAQGRTLITITHRPAGLATADEILVLHRGRVVEHGRHADLLARNGLYARMWQLRAL